jgi:hypothetical protein
VDLCIFLVCVCDSSLSNSRPYCGPGCHTVCEAYPWINNTHNNRIKLLIIWPDQPSQADYSHVPDLSYNSPRHPNVCVCAYTTTTSALLNIPNNGFSLARLLKGHFHDFKRSLAGIFTSHYTLYSRNQTQFIMQ